MTTHNSYANTLDPNGSITEQLNCGIRGIELDIHDRDLIEMVTGRWDKFKAILSGLTKRFRFHFRIGHWTVGHQVSRIQGNPRGNNLKDWLGKIADWSREKEKREGHAPITVFLDIKQGFLEKDNNPPEKYGLIRFNEQILNVFKKDKTRLFTLENFRRYNKEKEPKAWPSIEELRNKIILVLMSFHYEKGTPLALLPDAMKSQGTWIGLPLMKTRITYQEEKVDSNKIEQICFVAFNPEDHGKKGYKESLKEESWYVTPHDPPDDWKEYWDKGVIVRANYHRNEDDSWPIIPDYVNFPVTDHWKDDGYRDTTDWVV